jgi:hypothetical protein
MQELATRELLAADGRVPSDEADRSHKLAKFALEESDLEADMEAGHAS